MMVTKGFSREQFDTYMVLVDWLMAVPERLERKTTEAATIDKLDRLVEWLLWLPLELKEQT